MSDYQTLKARNKLLLEEINQLKKDKVYLEVEIDDLEERLEKCYETINDLEEKNKEYQIIIGTLLKGDRYGKKD